MLGCGGSLRRPFVLLLHLGAEGLWSAHRPPLTSVCQLSRRNAEASWCAATASAWCHTVTPRLALDMRPLLATAHGLYSDKTIVCFGCRSDAHLDTQKLL